MGNGGIPSDDESLQETHASSIPPTNASRNRRQKCLSGTTSHESRHAVQSSPSFIDSIDRQKRLFRLIRGPPLIRLLFISSSRNYRPVPQLETRFSRVFYPDQWLEIQPLASTHDWSRTRARDIVTYAITLDLCKCVEDTRARAHSWAARCWLKPFRFTSRPRFKKLSLSLTFGSIVYRLSNDPLRFPFPRSLVSFFFQWFEALIEVNLSTKYVYIHSSMCKSDIDCTRIRFPIHFRSKIYIFARYKNSLYPVIWRRRIIFIYIFRHCVHELNMKYRGGGVSRFTILNPSEISKRTKSRDFFRTRRRRYQ